jgi:membrane protease YdiL (CAAX protease family)
MEPETQSGLPEATPTDNAAQVDVITGEATDGLIPSAALVPAPDPHKSVRWIFMGNQGLRAGWSALLFLLMAFLLLIPLGFLGNLIAHSVLHVQKGTFTPFEAILQELVSVLAVLGAGVLVALIERRRLLDYYLTGPRRSRNFIGGLVAGFAGLSVLVGALALGGWLHFGPVALTGAQIFSNAALWGLCFLMVGFFEEGTFRCYLQFTLTRGINFWWALGIEAIICLDLLLRSKGNGVWGVYAVALLGLVPCLLLQLRKVEGAGFWQAAWVTSTVFGFIHTGNNGENWIGIFAAAAIGFVFCVSIWVTGSAWWAIGCHAGWDWAETYFYGTADSGMQAQGHYLTASPAGQVLWSGGTDGPEGSLLVLGAIILLLVALLVIYGRKRESVQAVATIEQLPS